jgi:thioredoxin 1
MAWLSGLSIIILDAALRQWWQLNLIRAESFCHLLRAMDIKGHGCGGGEISMKVAIHVSDDDFEKAVLQSPVPVLVDFWAPWCAPCRMVAPTLDKIAEEYNGRLVIAKVNTDENQRWATHFRVNGIPTMLFISSGQVFHEQVGAASYQALKQIVDHMLSSAGSPAAPNPS